MYSIGEFSKIGSVSTKTLRYYDEIGLLHPASVDEVNHYRYYSEEQVDQILHITELKSLDLRLEQIKAVIENGEIPLLERFLSEQIEEINCRIQKDIRLKLSIENKMRKIQSGGIQMNKECELAVEEKQFTPVWVMSKKATIEISQIGTVIGSVYEEIFRRGLQPAGPVMTFYLDEEFQHENANVEVCIPVDKKGREEDISGIRMLDPGLCAVCLYTGAYHKIGKAYAAVLKWIEENNYCISSAPFDSYLNNPQDVKNPEELMTQVWFPIKKQIS